MNFEWQRIGENVVKASKILIKKRLCGAFGHVSTSAGRREFYRSYRED